MALVGSRDEDTNNDELRDLAGTDLVEVELAGDVLDGIIFLVDPDPSAFHQGDEGAVEGGDGAVFQHFVGGESNGSVGFAGSTVALGQSCGDAPRDDEAGDDAAVTPDYTIEDLTELPAVIDQWRNSG